MAKTYEEINKFAEEHPGYTYGQTEEVFNTATPEQRMSWMAADNPVSGTSKIRQSIDLTKGAAGDFLSEIMNGGMGIAGEAPGTTGAGTSPTSDVSTAQADYEKLYQAMGITTDAEQAQIEAAGVTAGKAYDPLIAEAKSKSLQGQAQALVGAGERGGLMSSQFAGIAALAPIAGKSFVGAGGELERVASAYDLNISSLEAKKQAAISEAKAAAQKALRTGKQDDLNNAQQRWQDARQASLDQQSAITNKLNWIKGVQDIQTQAAADAEKAAKNIASNLVTTDEDGNIVMPTQTEITQAAEDSNMDFATLNRFVNDRAAEIQKLNNEEKRAEKASQSALRTEWQDMVDTGAFKGNLAQYAAFKATQYGTESKGGASGTVSGLSKADEKLFNVAVSNAKAAISADPTLWGQYWSGIKNQFPNIPNSTIDTYLGGGYDQKSGQWWGMANPEQAKTITNKGKAETAATIDPTTKSNLVDDINQGKSIDELIKDYPDVNTTLINQMYSAING